MTVTAPEGSILNATRPSALAARHMVGHLTPVALFGALAKVIPHAVIAEGAASVVVDSNARDRPARAAIHLLSDVGRRHGRAANERRLG